MIAVKGPKKKADWRVGRGRKTTLFIKYNSRLCLSTNFFPQIRKIPTRPANRFERLRL